MPTDIKLDQQDGNWLIAESNVFKSTAADFMLDSPGRRRSGPSSPMRRALVHDFKDGLTINYAGDYPGGVTVGGGLSVGGELKVGKLTVADEDIGAAVNQLQSTVSAMTGTQKRLDELEKTVDYILERLGAAIIPNWRTQEEVEEGDDMGMSARSAAELGLLIDYVVDQQNPAFEHGEVISITPPAGTPVLRGSKVVVRINLEG